MRCSILKRRAEESLGRSVQQPSGCSPKHHLMVHFNGYRDSKGRYDCDFTFLEVSQVHKYCYSVSVLCFIFVSGKTHLSFYQRISSSSSYVDHDYLPDYSRKRQQRHHQSCCEKQRLQQWTNQVPTVVRWYIFSTGGPLLSSAGSRYATGRQGSTSPLLNIT
jgi:hypothetical protein